MRIHKTWRLGMLTAAIAMIAALSGCERTKISDINKNPRTFAGNEVTIAGKVTSTAASSNPGTFQIDDGSGKLWVLSSKNEVPAQGAQVAVTGLVESGENMGSSSVTTTLQEIKRYGGGD